jgi:hypothetical protein
MLRFSYLGMVLHFVDKKSLPRCKPRRYRYYHVAPSICITKSPLAEMVEIKSRCPQYPHPEVPSCYINFLPT